jgi:carbamoyltransferase
MDLAASIQAVTEKVVLAMAKEAKRLTGSKNLCLAGGVALNCVANGKLLRSEIFENVFVTPASGDAGGALGAALFLHFHLLKSERKVDGIHDSAQGSLLGPKYENSEVRAFFDGEKIKYNYFEKEEDLLESTAKEMADQKIVGWFHGRMEFGPRALGGRSIIGDPRSSEMQSQMNLRIKFRESFRPFAPCVLREDVSEYFDLKGESPYMLIVADVAKKHWNDLTDEQRKLMKDPDLRKRVNVPRSSIPAITHVDMSARVQTVDEERHGRYYRLMKEFKKQTGCGVIINTSFNIRGEPIVNTPSDAYRCFMASDMDVLVVENCLLRKTEQPAQDKSEREKYIASFDLD